MDLNKDDVTPCFNEAFLNDSSLASNYSTESRISCLSLSDGNFKTIHSSYISSVSDEHSNIEDNSYYSQDSQYSTTFDTDGSFSGSEIRCMLNSISTSTENTITILSESQKNADNNHCKAVEKETIAKIKESNAWPIWIILEKNLTSSNNEEEQDDKILDNLYTLLEEDPERFAEQLSTIIENSMDCTIFEKQSSRYSIDVNNSINSTDSSICTDLSTSSTKDKSKTNKTTTNSSQKHKRRSLLSTRAKKMNFFVPTIVITPETPATRTNKFLEYDEGDEYITAESDVEIDKEESKNETLDMSNVNKQHKEWTKTYNKIYRYNTMSFNSAQLTDDHKKKIAKHKHRLEKRWMKDLEQKRKKCFDTIKNLIAIKSTIRKENISNEPSVCSCERCERRMEFYNTITDISNYCTKVCSGNLQDVSTNTSSCSASQSLKTPRKVKILPAGTSRKSVKIISPKSVGRKLKSPSKIIDHKVFRKTPGKLKKNTGAIDESSIKPVSELRQIYSPVNKGSTSCKNSIPKQQCPIMYTSTIKIPCHFDSANSTNKKCSPTGTSINKRFDYVKSPVGEYIRGKNKK